MHELSGQMLASVAICMLTTTMACLPKSLRLLLNAEIDKLSREKDLEQLCPYYINLQGEISRLQVLT